MAFIVVILVFLFWSLGDGTSSNADFCDPVDCDRVNIHWNFTLHRFQVFIFRGETITKTRLISNSTAHYCFETKTHSGAKITFTLSDTGVDVGENDVCDSAQLRVKEKVDSEIRIRSNSTRTKKSVTFKKRRKRPRKRRKSTTRRTTAAEIRLAKQFINKFNKLNRRIKNNEKLKESYARKYRKIENSIKKKTRKLRARNRRDTHQEDCSSNPINCRNNDVNDLRPPDCTVSTVVCPELNRDSGKFETQLNFNQRGCDLRVARQYIITLFNSTFMHNLSIEILFSTEHQTTAATNIMPSVTRYKSPSTRTKAENQSHSTGFMAAMNVTILLITSVLAIIGSALCVYCVRRQCRKRKRRRNNTPEAVMCDNCRLYCDLRTSEGRGSSQDSASPCMPGTSKDRQINRSHGLCSCCKFKRDNKKKNPRLCDRHRKQLTRQRKCDVCEHEQANLTIPVTCLSPHSTETYDFNSGCHYTQAMSTPSAMHTYTDYGPMSPRSTTNAYTGTSSTGATTHQKYEFPDGEQRYYPPALVEALKGDLMTPDFHNLNINKFRSPPNRTLFKNEVLPPSGSRENLPPTRRDKNGNSFQGRSPKTRRFFTTSKKQKKSSPNENFCSEHGVTPHSSILSNNNYGAEPPPLYSEVMNEGNECDNYNRDTNARH